jgi:hypothetical protein
MATLTEQAPALEPMTAFYFRLFVHLATRTAAILFSASIHKPKKRATNSFIVKSSM